MQGRSSNQLISSTVLVVDDYDDTLELLSRLISHNLPQANVLTASTGQEALTLAKQHEPDLILLDVQLPDINGFEVCRRLKASIANSMTPILMVSGEMVASEHRSEGLRSGADGYICKPFENEELLAQAKALLRVKQYQDQLLTQRAELETTLGERTRQLRTIYDRSPDAIYVEDLNGVVLDANPAACRLQGLPREKLVGRHYLDLIPAARREHAQSTNELLLSGAADSIEGFSGSADGRETPVEIRASRIDFEGEPALLLHVRDISERKAAEEELKASEEKFSNIFHKANDPILLHDLEGNILDVNETGLRHFGYERDAFLAMKLSQLHPEPKREKPSKSFLKKVEAGEYRFEATFCKANGSTFPAEVSASVFEWDGKQVVQGVIRDITERQQSEARQTTVRKGLLGVVEVADELIACTDVQTVYRRAVELAREKLGIERCAIFLADDNLVRCTYGTNAQGETTDESTNIQERSAFWDRCFTPVTSTELPCHVIDTMRTQWHDASVERLSEGWVAVTPIMRNGNIPGAVFSNDTAITNVPLDPDQQRIIAVYCSLLGDIIERKKAEERVLAAERQYRTLVEQLPAITYIVQFEGGSRTTYISPQVESLLGFTPEEWQADTGLWIRQVHPDDRAHVVEEIRKADAQHASYSLEYRVCARDGSVLWFRNHGIYVRSEEDEPQQLHGVMIDITGRKQAEDRERELHSKLSRAQRMESLGVLAGGVAHDLNNILGPLVAYPDLILSDLPEDSPLRDDVSEIGASARRAADVIQDLLSLARRGNYQLEPVELNSILAEHLGAVDFQILKTQHPNVSITVDFDEDLSPVMGSTPHLTRVVANLLTNAFEAMPEGGTLTLSTRNDHRSTNGSQPALSGSHVILEITDTGEGIESDDLERIFEPFYTKRKMGRSGTGLGLAVVYGVIRDLNGLVEVDSTPGEGTAFTIYLPTASEAPVTLGEPPLETPGTETVLIVDDVKEQQRAGDTHSQQAGLRSNVRRERQRGRRLSIGARRGPGGARHDHGRELRRPGYVSGYPTRASRATVHHCERVCRNGPRARSPTHRGRHLHPETLHL